MKRITIIGTGNIGLSLAKGLVKNQFCNADQITLTRRNIKALNQEREDGFVVTDSNIEAVRDADIIVFAILPQQLRKVLEEIAPIVQGSNQVFVSVVSGVSCVDIKEVLGVNALVVRAMPNTAIAIGQSMTCIATDNAPSDIVKDVEVMFETVGAVVVINEDLMTSATALCACGIAFFL